MVKINVKYFEMKVTEYYTQAGNCNHQDQKSCSRASGMLKHLCAYTKTGGQVCGGDHTKADHDVAKHGS